MVAAPVGFQCRECVAAATQSAPVYQVRGDTIVGGAKNTPYVSYTLVGLCVAIFLAQLATGLNDSVGQFGMRPFLISVDGQWYRLLTSAFMHWTFLHLAFNMLVLILLGPPLERAFGHLRFSALYILAALGGGVASYCFSPQATASVGASGAIFGLMGALVTAGRHLRVDVRQVLILLGINLVIGFISGGNIDWRAHLGGLAVGALVGALFAYASAKSGAIIQTGGCLLILAILVAAVNWRSAAILDEFTNIRGSGDNSVVGTAPAPPPDTSPRLPA